MESKGFPSNYYMDEIQVDGNRAFKVTLLSDTYFIPRIYAGNPDRYYFECKCDYDMEPVYFSSGDLIIAVTAIRNMDGQKTKNVLIEKTADMRLKARILHITNQETCFPKR